MARKKIMTPEQAAAIRKVCESESPAHLLKCYKEMKALSDIKDIVRNGFDPATAGLMVDTLNEILAIMRENIKGRMN